MTTQTDDPVTIEDFLARFDTSVLLRWLNAGLRAFKRKGTATRPPSVAALNRWLREQPPDVIERVKKLAISTS